MVERERLGRRSPVPSISEFEQHLAINEHGLQQECRSQPELFYHIARELAKARAEYEDAKAYLKRLSGEVELNVRLQAEQSEARVTEARIAALVGANEQVIAAGDALAERRVHVEQIDALKEAYMQRKDMLRELVQLYISNYYADPVRGNENRMREIATEGVRAARRQQQEDDNRRR